MSVPLLRRLIEYSFTLFIALSINFLLPRLIPGDPIALIAGDAVRQLGAERIAELRAEYGLDQPLSVQFLRYLGDLARGDLGQSYRYSGGRSVLEVIFERLGWTALLVGTGLTLATLLGSFLGVWSARRGGRPADLGMVGALFALRSMPSFWLAMILIAVFAVQLGWFPSGDSYSFPRPEGWASRVDVIRHAILPVSTLILTYLPLPFAIMRASLLEIISQDFIRTARAKGQKEFLVIYRHALRNALLPLVTAFALDFGQLLGGVTLIETVFNYRGVGSMMFEAVKSRDYPLLQGGFLFFTLGILIANFLAEGLYGRLDPRVREAMP